MSNRNRSSRRLFLRAAGATLALPTLPSLPGSLPSAAVAAPTPATSQPVGRFCCIYFPNGVSLPPRSHAAHQEWHWFPHETGTNYRFTRTLQPLEQLRSELTILSGLSHPGTRTLVGHVAGDTFLTGADQTEGYSNSVSVDQVYAAHVGTQTRFPSLALSSDGGVGSPGRAKTLSFSPSGKPIPSLWEPRQIFNRLFGVDERSRQAQRRAFGNDRSILDHVWGEARAIRKRLAPADQQRMDQYLTSVREIERRLARADRWLDVQKPLVEPQAFDLDLTPGEGGEDYIRVILDLMVAAISSDSTRALTYQITSEDAKGIGDRFPHVLGLKGHHNLSHSVGRPKGYVEWARYDQFLARQLAYFLQRLQATDDPENEGSLLDHTVVLYGCGTSRTHQAVNYPLVLAGGKRLGLQHGCFHRWDESRVRMSNLYVTLLRQLGMELEHFADSNGVLPELVAG